MPTTPEPPTPATFAEAETDSVAERLALRQQARAAVPQAPIPETFIEADAGPKGGVRLGFSKDEALAHVKAMLTGVGLHIPVIGGALALGTWQGIYVAEHRLRAHRREVVVQFIGSRA